jgi:hypothetical protein
MSLQMLSLKYYGIVHKADTEDYMQSLRVHDELDKNDFRQHMYAVRVKPIAEPSDPTTFFEELRTVDVSSQLFLSSKRTRGEQLQIIGSLYVGGAFLLAPIKTVNASQTQRRRPTVKKVNK